MVALSLEGRAVAITGPAKGMGRAITLAIAESGGDVALLGRDTAAIAPVAEEVETMGRSAIVLPCDITDENAVDLAVNSVAEAYGDRITGLVNVAGTTGPSGAKLWEHTVDDFRDVFDVNVLGSFLTMKHLLPRMMASGAGSIVNIGGTFGFKGVRDAALYGASKWTLRGLTKSAALEAGSAGVRVNMVSPGGVDGPRLTRQLGEAAEREGLTYEDVYDRFCKTTALGRMSTDGDVAAAVVFLLSDAARNITGQDLLVDGGTIV
jgi:NAD(P)-dependent dehydrogenase (short-subunit alcohol dehydrogenase family)